MKQHVYKPYKPTVLASVIAALSLTSSVNAQSVLEEIVVVAQKREQNLQEVPIAISAFTGAQMDALGVSESFDIATFSPGVHISGTWRDKTRNFLFAASLKTISTTSLRHPTQCILMRAI